MGSHADLDRGGPPLFQDLFSRQKGYLEEELDYRKEALDQAYLVGLGVGWSLWLVRLSLRGCVFLWGTPHLGAPPGPRGCHQNALSVF